MTKYMTSVNHVYNRIDDTEIIEADFGPILEHDEMGQVKQYHNTWEDAHKYLLKCANRLACHLNARLRDMEDKIKIIEAMQGPCAPRN